MTHTNTTKLSPDDPRLTAFALGELEGEELAAVEAALRDDPAARAAVEEIRAMAAQLESALAVEAAADLPSAATPQPQKAAVIQGSDPAKLDGGPLGKVIKFPNLKFPQLYYLVGGLAAAAFAVLIAYQQQPVRQVEALRAKKESAVAVMEVALPPIPTASDAKNEADLSRADSVAKVAGQVAEENKRDELSAQADAARERQLTAAVDQAKLANSPAPASSANQLNTLPQLIGQNRYIQSTNSYDRKQLQANNQQANGGKDEEAMKAKAPNVAVAGASVGAIEPASVSPALSKTARW